MLNELSSTDTFLKNPEKSVDLTLFMKKVKHNNNKKLKKLA
jgi:hypothetical protein